MNEINESMATATNPDPLSAFDLSTNIPTTDSTPAANAAADTTLPADYLASGYYATTDKGATYLRPEYVGIYAQTIATQLSSMKLADINSLLKELKRSKKSTLPFEARQTAALELIPKAMALVKRKKAPALLLEFIKCNIDAIKTDADWMAFLRHMNAIAAYMEGRDN